MIAQVVVSICAFIITPPFLGVSLAARSCGEANRSLSCIDRTSVQTTVQLVLESDLNGSLSRTQQSAAQRTVRFIRKTYLSAQPVML